MGLVIQGNAENATGKVFVGILLFLPFERLGLMRRFRTGGFTFDQVLG
jgi:hypothetical protein